MKHREKKRSSISCSTLCCTIINKRSAFFSIEIKPPLAFSESYHMVEYDKSKICINNKLYRNIIYIIIYIGIETN
jgi:hypothetical protein